LTGLPGPPCSIQRGSPPLCTPADGSLIPLPDRELAADARSAIELAVPTATVGDGLAIGNTRWLAPDLLDELEPGTRSGRRSGCRVRDDVGAADVIAVLVGASRGRSSHRPGAWTTGLTLLSCSTAYA